MPELDRTWCITAEAKEATMSLPTVRAIEEYYRRHFHGQSHGLHLLGGTCGGHGEGHAQGVTCFVDCATNAGHCPLTSVKFPP